jgi:short chain dehydrogenase
LERASSPNTAVEVGRRCYIPDHQALRGPDHAHGWWGHIGWNIVDRIIGNGLDTFGRIDTLINNVGIFMSKPFTDYTADDYAAMIGVNLTGSFWLTQRAIAEMLTGGGGHVVNITTTLVDFANSRIPSRPHHAGSPIMLWLILPNATRI